MSERLGSIEIRGVVYPLNYSMRIAQQYNDLLTEKIQGDFAFMERNLKVLALMMEDGAAYKKVFGEETVAPLSLEALRLSVSPADAQKIADAIIDTAQRAGMRRVEANPGKNGETAPEEAENQTGKKN